MRVITEHRCSKRHRNASSFARCAWPAAASITGTGVLALVSTCDGGTRVRLGERLQWIRVVEAELNTFGCGPGCTRDHEIVAIDLDGPAPEVAA